MERENIRLINKLEIKKRRKDFNNFNRNKIEENVIIKKKFFNQEFNEHMWVKIIEIKRNGIIQGILINQPILLDGLDYGDMVKIRLKEIEDFLNFI